jgi:ribosome-binding protein aMBF1 (putative translation factor)
MIKNYDLLPDGTDKCEICGTQEDITLDEDGMAICTDCLFERETQKEYENKQ